MVTREPATKPGCDESKGRKRTNEIREPRGPVNPNRTAQETTVPEPDGRLLCAAQADGFPH